MSHKTKDTATLAACAARSLTLTPLVLLAIGAAAALGACASVELRPAQDVATATVNALARRDIDSLAALAHPDRGIRFTPYTHVDTTRDRRLLPAELRAQWNRPDSLLWGAFDGSGEPMRLTFRQYVDRFVYDFDFAQAPRVARDSLPMGIGNSLYNLREVYPNATIVEYNSPGTDPKYGGMDWRSLWIVLEKTPAGHRVVGIVHGSWTT